MIHRIIKINYYKNLNKNLCILIVTLKKTRYSGEL